MMIVTKPYQQHQYRVQKTTIEASTKSKSFIPDRALEQYLAMDEKSPLLDPARRHAEACRRRNSSSPKEQSLDAIVATTHPCPLCVIGLSSTAVVAAGSGCGAEIWALDDIAQLGRSQQRASVTHSLVLGFRP